MKKILRVEMSNLTVRWEEAPPAYEKFGGRSLIAKIMQEEVPPHCHPLGSQNKLIFAPGLLGGTNISSSGRISIGGKSPLTGTIKESNGGGTTGAKLARLGLKAVVIEGKPAEPGCYVLKISAAGAEVVSAPELKGMGVYETARKLGDRFGARVGMALIGPAGENLLAAAGIANLDQDGNPSRYCGRGGLGAVMGAKGIKAVVVDDRGTANLPAADSAKMKSTLQEYNNMFKSPAVEAYTRYGTSAMVAHTNALGCLPTRSFTRGRFWCAEKISGETMYNLILTRGGTGRTTHSCMPGCLIRCSNVFPDEKGEVAVSPLEYETIGMFGANLEIDDLDTIARCNYLCNDLGLDTIETAVAIGLAMQAGVLPFGDRAGVLNLLPAIGRGTTVLGRVLGQGAAVTGRVLGVTNIPAVKGQALPAYDPRSLKGIGVTYATSPMGADHTAGPTARAKVDHLNPQGQVELSRRVQLNSAIYDNLGLCLFVTAAVGARPQILADLLNARYGWQWGVEDLFELSKKTILMEREFNRRAGFTPAHDRLPE